jgi:endoglucanase
MKLFRYAILAMTVLAALTGCRDKKELPNVIDGTGRTITAEELAIPTEAYFTDLYDFKGRPAGSAVLGRGMNLGNALDAPSEGSWGVIIKPEYFTLLAESGFDTVRIPIRWSNHTSKEKPWTLRPQFVERVVKVVDMGMASGLKVVINVHHFREMMADPRAEEEEFLSIWTQICAIFPEDKYPADRLYFELCNEPTENFTADLWNDIMAETITTIRPLQPNRTLIVGPVEWNSLRALNRLELPEGEKNLIVTFHYYEPMEFTHQGAEWVEHNREWIGTTWTGTPEERTRVINALDGAAAWSAAHDGIPLWLGEFGAYAMNAAPEDRALYTAFITREAEKRNISWAYWELVSGFSAWNQTRKEWQPGMKEALTP